MLLVVIKTAESFLLIKKRSGKKKLSLGTGSCCLKCLSRFSLYKRFMACCPLIVHATVPLFCTYFPKFILALIIVKLFPVVSEPLISLITLLNCVTGPSELVTFQIARSGQPDLIMTNTLV
jgi:hypothetical protein